MPREQYTGHESKLTVEEITKSAMTVVNELKKTGLPDGIFDCTLQTGVGQPYIRIDSNDNDPLVPFEQLVDSKLQEFGLKLGDEADSGFSEGEQSNSRYVVEM